MAASPDSAEASEALRAASARLSTVPRAGTPAAESFSMAAAVTMCKSASLVTAHCVTNAVASHMSSMDKRSLRAFTRCTKLNAMATPAAEGRRASARMRASSPAAARAARVVSGISSQSKASASVLHSWPKSFARPLSVLLSPFCPPASPQLSTKLVGVPARVPDGNSTGFECNESFDASAFPGADIAKECFTFGNNSSKEPHVERSNKPGKKCQGNTRLCRINGCSNCPPAASGKPCTHARKTRQTQARQWRQRRRNSGSALAKPGRMPTKPEPRRSATRSSA
mmetsp:Transcript_57975/g.168154  ORF Transcript_57975/g.168154 Transcript_57975/m.168154 type:complete len:284 (-) Transcript_57975:255-1106(-)